MKRRLMNILTIFALIAIGTTSLLSAPLVRQAGGANPAAIQATVDQFRADLGGSNNGVGGSFRNGRREINWDGVPDGSSAPNFLAPDFFNVNSPRGLVMNAIELNGTSQNDFVVSADSSNPTNTPVRFGDIDPSYTANFQTFSAQRLLTIRGANLMEVVFFVPGTKIPATVAGFGVVFSDEDVSTGSRAALIRCYAPNGTQLAAFTPTAASGGLSFAGVTFTAGERISRCTIQTGNAPLAAGNVDSASTDVIAMDDFIYGEPRSEQWHSSDFDGDGFTDPTVFRPSTGGWFTYNTGSATVSINQWGQNGDVPLDGDFDGDKLGDLAIYRPSDGSWWILKSSDGQVFATPFGQNGDKPTPGDFDKDGKTDLAFWRPSDGSYYVIRSSNNSFFSFPWGQNGDIPLQVAGL